MNNNTQWVVYILRCADQTLYTGITTNIERRLAEHNGDKPGGAKYTSSRRPVALFYTETAQNRSAAGKREFEIKQLSRAKKLQLSHS